ncbi:hypothetical protein BU15DRAFT_59431 [Melanogaster broomeanus]|nr:hypothetical protein BU15DRAFT_59431 [Melanogaster broomeanus]
MPIMGLQNVLIHIQWREKHHMYLQNEANCAAPTGQPQTMVWYSRSVLQANLPHQKRTRRIKNDPAVSIALDYGGCTSSVSAAGIAAPVPIHPSIPYLPARLRVNRSLFSIYRPNRDETPVHFGTFGEDDAIQASESAHGSVSSPFPAWCSEIPNTPSISMDVNLCEERLPTSSCLILLTAASTDVMTIMGFAGDLTFNPTTDLVGTGDKPFKSSTWYGLPGYVVASSPTYSHVQPHFVIPLMWHRKMATTRIVCKQNMAAIRSRAYDNELSSNRTKNHASAAKQKQRTRTSKFGPSITYQWCFGCISFEVEHGLVPVTIKLWHAPLIAKSGALIPLTRLARSKDMRVQHNAMGARLNMSIQPVNAGAIPVLIGSLNSVDTDVQYYSATVLSNIAVDGANRKKFVQTEPNSSSVLSHSWIVPV